MLLQLTISLSLYSGFGCDVSTEEELFDYMILLNITLALSNIIMIYFILDLALILTNCGGRENSHRPKLDYMVCGIKWIINLLASWIFCHKKKQKKHEEDGRREGGQLSVTFDDYDREVIIRNYNRNRHSMTRRRTPRTFMDWTCWRCSWIRWTWW